MRHIFQTTFFLLIIVLGYACVPKTNGAQNISNNNLETINISVNPVVDSIYENFSISQKIGQLVLFDASENKNTLKELSSWIKKDKINGIILSKIDIKSYTSFYNDISVKSRAPFMGTSTSSNLSTHFKNKIVFPSFFTTRANQQDSLNTQIEDLYFRQLKSLGVNLVFDKYLYNKNRTSTFRLYSTGNTQKENQLFLGYTPPKIDSNLIFNPYINSDLCHISNQEFKLTPKIINKIEDLNLDSLINYDIFITKEQPYKLVAKIISGIKKGQLDLVDLEQKIKNIISLQTTIQPKPFIDFVEAQYLVNNDILEHQINNIKKNGICLLNNGNHVVVPIKNIAKKKLKIFNYGVEVESLKNTISRYRSFSEKTTTIITDSFPPFEALETRTKFCLVIINDIKLTTKNSKSFIHGLNKSNKENLLLINIQNPNNLNLIPSSISCIQTFDKGNQIEDYIGQIAFGGISPSGKLPIHISDALPKGEGSTFTPTRLAYLTPESQNIASVNIEKVSEFIFNGIKQKAFPGCQVLVAKNGTVVYQKAFGYHTYDKFQLVQNHNLYDIASLTKVCATTLGAMKQYDDKKLDLNSNIHSYFGDTDKKLGKLRVKDLLKHHTGLPPNLPIANFLHKPNIKLDCSDWYCTSEKQMFTNKIIDNLFVNNKYVAKVWQDLKSYTPGRKRYRYGDVNFFFLQKIIEQTSKTDLKNYLNKNFYFPLGLSRILFNPLERYTKKEIAPTELDTKWRNSLIRGYAHDPVAAIHNGVAGNAGLFANTNDIAVLFEMLLNNGSYGSQQFLSEQTVKEFTKKQYKSNRGLGFDKPTKKRRTQPCAKQASKDSFGHSGFTGTLVWADPKEDLIYVFLTNRIYPSRDNWKINKMNIREKIHEQIYKSLDSYTPSWPDYDKILKIPSITPKEDKINVKIENLDSLTLITTRN